MNRKWFPLFELKGIHGSLTVQVVVRTGVKDANEGNTLICWGEIQMCP